MDLELLEPCNLSDQEFLALTAQLDKQFAEEEDEDET